VFVWIRPVFGAEAGQNWRFIAAPGDASPGLHPRSGQLNRLTGPRFRLGAALLGPLYTGSQAAFTLDRRNSLVLQATVNRKR